MSLQQIVVSFFKRNFVKVQEKRERCLAYQASQRFIHGLAVYKSIVIPMPLITAINSTMMVLIITENIINIKEINWFDKFVEYNLCYPAVFLSILIMKNKNDLIFITESIDIWWQHPFMEYETKTMRKKTESWLKLFTTVYYIFMITGSMCVFFMPLGKYIWNGRKNSSDLLLFKCWSPVPLNRAWGLTLMLLFEIAAQSFPFIIYSAIGTYLITMTMLFYHQTQIIGIAFRTMETRAWKMVEDVIEKTENAYELYMMFLKQEITNCARNYQNLYRYLQKMCNIFTITTNILYYTGMFLLITSGLQIVSKNANSLLLFQAVMLIASVIVNQYLNSFVTETLSEAAWNLRIAVYDCDWYKMPKECKTNIHLIQTLVSYSPKLTTILGATCDKEFLSKVINASYCYFNTLYSTRSE